MKKRENKIKSGHKVCSVSPAPAAHSRPSVRSWHTVIVDGHSVEELCKAFGQAKHQPTAIIAKTFKGRGIPGSSAQPSSPTPPLLPGAVANRGGGVCTGGRVSEVRVWGSARPLAPHIRCTELGNGEQGTLCSVR